VLKLLLKSLKVMRSMRNAKGNLGKEWYRSKTLYANVFAVAAIILARTLDFTLDAEMTTTLMAAVNIVLRLLTGEAVGFLREKPNVKFD